MQDIALLYIDDSVKNDLVFRGTDLVETVSSALTGIGICSNIVVSVGKNYSGKYVSHANLFRRTTDDISDWKKIFSEYDAENIIKVFADSPFLDAGIISEMMAIHRKYLAEFTYSENLPQGFSCIIVSRDLVSSIPEADEKMLPLENVVKANINQFDVELFYKGPDIRDKRLNFRISDNRERLILENIYDLKHSVPSYIEMRDIIEKNPHVLYVGPSYYEIELTCNSQITSVYSYRPMVDTSRSDLSLDCFRKIINDADTLGMKYSVCLGGAGDPMMHPSFYEIVGIALKSSFLERLVIETDGLLCDGSFVSFLHQNNDSRIHIILDCSGHDAESYSHIHQSDNYDKVFSNIMLLKEYFGEDSDRFFIQIMKINETEKFLDAYYDFWMKQKVSIILQKQNTFLGKIEDRRYYDLSPVERIPCWHLQRDLYFLSDGTAAFCKQDINGDSKCGNIQEKSVSEIWEDKKQFFADDYTGKYCTDPDCRKCDEWYTFNF